MKDIITNQRILVTIDPEYGPFITLNDYNQFDELDDKFTEELCIEYYVRFLKDSEGNEVNFQMFFGKEADPNKIQKILNALTI